MLPAGEALRHGLELHPQAHQHIADFNGKSIVMVPLFMRITFDLCRYSLEKMFDGNPLVFREFPTSNLISGPCWLVDKNHPVGRGPLRDSTKGFEKGRGL